MCQRTTNTSFLLFLLRTLRRPFNPLRLDSWRVAFVHRSVRPCDPHALCEVNNERLEFLGDALIEALVSEALYERLPHAQEGALSQLRAALVCRAQLNRVALRLGFDRHIECADRHTLTTSHLPGDALEAFVAVTYQRLGWCAARSFVRRHLTDDVSLSGVCGGQSTSNPKSDLLSWAQKHHRSVRFDTREVPVERDLVVGGKKKMSGPLFVCDVLLDDEVVSTAQGHNKKEAEQSAAAGVSVRE